MDSITDARNDHYSSHSTVVFGIPSGTFLGDRQGHIEMVSDVRDHFPLIDEEARHTEPLGRGARVGWRLRHDNLWFSAVVVSRMRHRV